MEPGRAACMCAEEREYITTERVAVIVWQLADGEALTTAQVAEIAGISRQGAFQMLQKLARVIPILCFDGEWMPAVVAEVLCPDELDESPM